MFSTDFTYRVYVQEWEEYERGWGRRSDGATLHRTEEDAKSFCNNYINRNHTSVHAPDEYSLPSGSSYWGRVSQEVHDWMEKKYSEGGAGLWIGEGRMDLITKD